MTIEKEGTSMHQNTFHRGYYSMEWKKLLQGTHKYIQKQNVDIAFLSFSPAFSPGEMIRSIQQNPSNNDDNAKHKSLYIV